MRKMRWQTSDCALYVPGAVLLAGVSVFPFFWLIAIAFHAVTARTLHSDWRFAGLSNFTDVLWNLDFWRAALRTLELTTVSVLLEVILGVMFALVFHGSFRSSRLVVTVFSLPVLASTIVVGLTWKYLFALDNGIINSLLGTLGLPQVPWLTVRSLLPAGMPSWVTTAADWLNLNFAFLSLIVIEVWQWTPLVTLIVLARLSSLPPRLWESAAIDGLNYREFVQWVLAPQLKRIILIVCLLRTVDTFRVFETVWALFGDLVNTETLSVTVFREALFVRDYGEAAAMAVALFVMCMATCAVILFIGRPNSLRAQSAENYGD